MLTKTPGENRETYGLWGCSKSGLTLIVCTRISGHVICIFQIWIVLGWGHCRIQGRHCKWIIRDRITTGAICGKLPVCQSHGGQSLMEYDPRSEESHRLEDYAHFVE
jgi:hypothetical protein